MFFFGPAGGGRIIHWTEIYDTTDTDTHCSVGWNDFSYPYKQFLFFSRLVFNLSERLFGIRGYIGTQRG